MAGCGSKKMAKGGMVKKSKGGMMISPRKAMAMGKKPSGSKTKVKKFAAGGMVGGIRAPTKGPLPGANPRIPGMPGGPLNRNNTRFGQGTGSPAPRPAQGRQQLNWQVAFGPKVVVDDYPRYSWP